METPPQFAPPGPPPKRSNTVLIVVLSLVGACALCCILLLVAGIGFLNKAKDAIGCTTHYPFVRMAMREYALAHNNKLPSAANWQDEIAPYYLTQKDDGSLKKNKYIDFGDPSGDLGCKASNGSPATGMAFNDEFAGKTLDAARKLPGEVFLYEVPETGRNLHGSYKDKAPTGTSPNKIFGQPRPWFTLTVTGSMNGQQSPVTDERTAGL